MTGSEERVLESRREVLMAEMAMPRRSGREIVCALGPF